MNFHFGRAYHLFPRGGAGLSCDEDGVALGGLPPIWARPIDDGLRYEKRSRERLGEILRLAYGAQPPGVIDRCDRGLKRMVASLEAGDLVLASLEAVMTGFPDLGRAGFGRLAGVADLEKAGTAWQDEPRIPAGQSNGGQWTTGGVGAASSPRINGERALDSTPDKDSTRSQLPGLDDGVYHPGHDSPVLVPAGGPGDAEEGFRQGIGGNEPPYDFMELSELFPGLRDAPGLEIPLAPIDSFLGFSALANESNLQATSAVYGYLYDQIKAMDPSYRDDELQSLAEMSWEGRAAVIDKLLMDRAADYYRFKHEIEPLQVETVKLLQREVDKAYT